MEPIEDDLAGMGGAVVAQASDAGDWYQAFLLKTAMIIPGMCHIVSNLLNMVHSKLVH